MRFGIREIIFVLLLLAMPVLAYFIRFEKQNKTIERINDDMKRKLAKLEELEQVTRRVPDLGKEIDSLTEAIEMIEQKLPDERKVDEVLKQVWEMAARQRLTPKSVRTDKPLPNNQFSELPIQMEIVGDFDGFYSFLLELEKMPRITQLPKMKLTKLQEKDREQGQMRAEVVLSVFFETDDSALFGGTKKGRRGL
jgi:type IV pilus assembly protein PilO